MHHRQLDDVGAGALNGRIGGCPQLLGLHAGPAGHLQIDLQGILAQQPAQAIGIKGKRAPPAQDRLHVAAAEGKTLLQFQKGEHPGIALLVFGEELFGLGLANPGFAGKALGAHAIDHAEIDRFAKPPFILADLVFFQQQPGGEGMHIVTGLVGLHQHRFAREVGEDAQLNLAVVGTDQLPALLGQEGLANPPGKFRANRDVLQVGIAAR